MNTKEFVNKLKDDEGVGLLIEDGRIEYLMVRDPSKIQNSLRFVRLSDGWLYYHFTGDDQLSQRTMDTLLEVGYELRYADDLHSYFHTEYGEVEKIKDEAEKVFESEDYAKVKFTLDLDESQWERLIISTDRIKLEEVYLYPEDAKKLQKFLNDNLQ